MKQRQSNIWNIVREGDLIGAVRTVLKKDKGRPMTMLHIEQYEKGYRGSGEIWELEREQPCPLLDITPLLKSLL